MPPFDANDYRKRVLAGIEARGGVAASDPFEWYDLPLDDVRDALVAAQVEAVWGFWQKSRDSPKYRGLATALLATHRDTAPLLLERSSRRLLAERVRRSRQDRDADRSGPLDAAVARLVERFGGVPSSKLAGLRELGLASGLPPSAVDERLARVAVVQTRSAPPALHVPEDVRRQVRADLDELGRLLGDEPFATLHELLGLPPGASRDEVRAARDAAAARNRELRPDRRRALVDDLLAAVTRLLLDGDPDAYLDAVAEDVRSRLRPRLAAALLVEDVLTPADSAALLGEAQAGGLDLARAERVLAGLTAELGAALPPPRRARPPRTGLRGDSGGPLGEAAAAAAPPPASGGDLAPARAALAAGRVREAQRLVEQAHRRAGRTPPELRVLADEVRAAADEAGRTWRLVEQALERRRSTEALAALDRLVRTAVDVPSPTGRTAAQALELARSGLLAAAEALAAAERLTGAAREAAVLQAARDHPDAEQVLAAVAALGVEPATGVHAVPVPGGVLVRWSASPSSGEVDYRVQRLAADGRGRTVGTTGATELEDGAPLDGPSPPVYAVEARRAGQVSAPARSDGAAAAAPADPPPVSGLRAAGEVLRWEWPPGCTEVLVVWRCDAPPTGVDDPSAQRRKTTNTRYELDGGAPLPPERPVHVAVHACTRMRGQLVPARSAPPGARLALGAVDAPGTDTYHP